ncbi:MAG: Rieske 2Fe-2S domain-containing protein [Verrucomicrobiota bacterium]|nr:Rieske 2Fe-2S domain-containing protein [Verrucomicrobiota bacterium]
MTGFFAAKVTDLPPGQTLKFRFVREGIRREGFLANFNATIVAYENVCRHVPVTLDYGDNRFFEKSGNYFICQTHGAIYEPLTGLCVRGPCGGASLKKIEFELRGGEIWILEEALAV